MSKGVIAFDRTETWVALVESCLSDPQSYVDRLALADIERSHWDCSGLGHVISPAELKSILGAIEERLDAYSLRLYHGCRFADDANPKTVGLLASSTEGIERSLLEMAVKDPILTERAEAIREAIDHKRTREQARARNGQVWFCTTWQEMIEEGGVYCVFGSEYRLWILKSIDDSLKHRLLRSGTPSIVVVVLPIESYFQEFKNRIAKFLFALWIHHRLGLDDAEIPTGFACWIEQSVPPAFVDEVIRPEKVRDTYNDGRWYAWDEMFLKD